MTEFVKEKNPLKSFKKNVDKLFLKCFNIKVIRN